jgi:hypothetical protein
MKMKMRTTYRNAVEIRTVLEEFIRSPQPRHPIRRPGIRRRCAALQVPTPAATHRAHPIRLVGAEAHETGGFGAIRFPRRLPRILALDAIQDRLLELRREVGPRCGRLFPCVVGVVRAKGDAESGEISDDGGVGAVEPGC